MEKPGGGDFKLGSSFAPPPSMTHMYTRYTIHIQSVCNAPTPCGDEQRRPAPGKGVEAHGVVTQGSDTTPGLKLKHWSTVTAVANQVSS